MTGCGESIKIVSPINDSSEVRPLAEGGADEFYCGFLPGGWTRTYSDSDSLTRRQGNIANIDSLTQLERLAVACREADRPVSLALNVRYTGGMIPDIHEIVDAWAQMGGTGIIVSDLNLLLALSGRHGGLKRCLSILAVAFNSRTVEFYRQFGVTRVVLPRALSIWEMKGIAAQHPDIEFEAMILHDKCRFIDGYCNFYHGTKFEPYAAAVNERLPVVYANDLMYMGHGCQILAPQHTGKPRDSGCPPSNRPNCGACFILKLYEAHVRHLKLGGRGYPLALKENAVRFVKTAAVIAATNPRGDEMKLRMQGLYRQFFHSGCSGQMCYYQDGGAADGPGNCPLDIME